jgi:hypothetical protein
VFIKALVDVAPPLQVHDIALLLEDLAYEVLILRGGSAKNLLSARKRAGRVGTTVVHLMSFFVAVGIPGSDSAVSPDAAR